MPNLPTEARDIFLAHFPQTKRGTIANWFLEPIRDHHADTPHGIVGEVLSLLDLRLESPWGSDQAKADAQFALDMILAHRDEATNCAHYYLDYERLPAAERAALKEHEREQHRTAYMAAQPPTDRQLAYLRTLGYLGEPPNSMHEASEAIDHLLAARGKAVSR